VGLIPLFAVEQFDEEALADFPSFRANFHWFLTNRNHLTQDCVTTLQRNGRPIYLLALVNERQLERVLARVGDPGDFLAPYGLRSLSRYHAGHPFILGAGEVRYEPAEALTPLKGGNSNWRGPIWFPTTFLLIEALCKFAQAYGP